jgi:hypothetical protein
MTAPTGSIESCGGGRQGRRAEPPRARKRETPPSACGPLVGAWAEEVVDEPIDKERVMQR